jgi:16S rRNA A1518/A1519 N6-dimethyltransferase RsmA/KsgA/DIM1 with predicted DNA glycosylase/AP lyase activity
MLGQHFLISEDVCKLIVESASLRKNDLVFEIGTGTGQLTKKIAPLVLKVVSCEKDHYLYMQARDKLSGFENVSLIEGDALALSREEIPFDICVTSLPYSRSRDFVEWLACRSGTFREALAVLQLDFARKLLAHPSDHNYRSVSVIAQIAFQMREISLVDRTSFEPPPRVQSAIVKFEVNASFRQPYLNRERIRELRRLFSFKGRLLKNAIKSDDLKTKKVDLSQSQFRSMRIEDILPQQFGRLLEEIS